MPYRIKGIVITLMLRGGMRKTRYNMTFRMETSEKGGVSHICGDLAFPLY